MAGGGHCSGPLRTRHPGKHDHLIHYHASHALSTALLRLTSSPLAAQPARTESSARIVGPPEDGRVSGEGVQMVRITPADDTASRAEESITAPAADQTAAGCEQLLPTSSREQLQALQHFYSQAYLGQVSEPDLTPAVCSRSLPRVTPTARPQYRLTRATSTSPQVSEADLTPAVVFAFTQDKWSTRCDEAACALLHAASRARWDLRRRPQQAQIKVASVGGGPANDAAGFACFQALAPGAAALPLKLTVFDLGEAWRSVVEVVASPDVLQQVTMLFLLRLLLLHLIRLMPSQGLVSAAAVRAAAAPFLFICFRSSAVACRCGRRPRSPTSLSTCHWDSSGATCARR